VKGVVCISRRIMAAFFILVDPHGYPVADAPIDQPPYRNASIRTTVSDGMSVLETDKIVMHERGAEGGQSSQGAPQSNPYRH